MIVNRRPSRGCLPSGARKDCQEGHCHRKHAKTIKRAFAVGSMLITRVEVPARSTLRAGLERIKKILADETDGPNTKG